VLQTFGLLVVTRHGCGVACDVTSGVASNSFADSGTDQVVSEQQHSVICKMVA